MQFQILHLLINHIKIENLLDTLNIVFPLSDHIRKDRWCPSGNCLYTEWLLN